jgi:hypothetical protein
MSRGTICRWGEHEEAVNVVYLRSYRSGRLWRVLQRECNHSSFSGGHYTSSEWSAVACLRCGAVWRTRAAYVSQLRDIEDSERFVSVGYDGHVAAMKALGRTPHPNHSRKWHEEGQPRHVRVPPGIGGHPRLAVVARRHGKV